MTRRPSRSRRFLGSIGRGLGAAPRGVLGRALWALGLTGPFAPDKMAARAARRLNPAPSARRAARRWGLRIAAAAVGVNLAWLGVAALGAYGWPLLSRLGGEREWTEFQRIADRARAVALYDSGGRYFGILSAGFDRDHIGGATPDQANAADVIPDHKALPVEDAPRWFWRCLVYLEDRNRGGWDNPFGISFRGFALIPYRILASLASGRLRLPGGGSTLEMQLARSLRQQYRHNTNALWRKLAEWRAAPVLNARLIDGDGDRRFRAWVAQHLSLIQAAGGEQDVYGVEAAGRLLFGHGADMLDPAEQLILAATTQRPLRLRASPEQRRARLAALIGAPEQPGRALICADPDSRLDGAPVIEDDALRAAARAKLLRLAGEPFLGPTVEPALRPYAADLLRNEAGPRLDPQRLAAALGYGLEVEAVAGLIDRVAGSAVDRERHLWRGAVAAVRLTVDLPRNLALEREIDRAVEVIERRAAGGSPPRLAAGVLGSPGRRLTPLPDPREHPDVWLTPYVGQLGERAPLLVAAADRDGRIVRLVNTSADSLYSGAAATRPDWGFFGEGPYESSRERRAIASLGKVGAALLLAEAGMSDPQARLNNRCPPGLSRHCQGVGGDGARFVSAHTAFAQSLNSAVANALAARVSDRRIDAFAAKLGLGVGVEESPPTPPPARLALGRYTARPMAVQLLMEAAYAYAKGDFDARLPLPRLIEAVRPFDPVAERFTADRLQPEPRRWLALRDLVAPGPDPEASARFVRRMLSAPICEENRATLRRLRRWCAETNPLVTLHLAKTGTAGPGVAVDGYDESDWWIAGAIEFADGRAYTYVVAAGVGAPDAPFARGLGAGRLSPVVDALLRDLARAP